ncbi:MAG TPA: sulfatase [Gemmataceae bacterium]|nr:sulfatase [Gemmataceae bacterium]
MRTAVLSLAALLLAAPPCAAEPARRNVVLLIADDMGLDAGCYGNSAIRTPNIDALAKRGTRFTHAFATVSSCSPSRAALYTGLHTHTSGQYGLAHAEHNQRTRPNVKSLPTYLKAAGYRTGILAKVHVLPKEVYPFDVEDPAGGGRDVAKIAKAARKFIEESGGRPFCLVCGFTDPHRMGAGFANDKTYPGVPEVRYDPKDVRLPYHVTDTPEARRDFAEYYQSVSRLDYGVGLVMKALEETKTADSTLVIFLSDNGIPFPGAKTTLYDAGLRLPLIVASPAQKKPGTVCGAMASWVDVLPTILDWAGVKAPAVLAGRSLLPVLDEPSPKGWDEVFGSHQFHEITMYYPMRMVRTRTHKLILNLAHRLEYPNAQDVYVSPTWQGVLRRRDKAIGKRPLDSFLNRPREELYDLTKDPDELNDVAGDPAYADVLNDLRKRLKEWQKKTNDPWLVKYEHE